MGPVVFVANAEWYRSDEKSSVYVCDLCRIYHFVDDYYYHFVLFCR